MRQKPKFKKYLLSLAVAASLTACGGGGGGGSSSASSSVGGTASKGIIIGGTVNAYAIDADGSIDRTTPLASPALTIEDGTYSLSLNSSYVAGTALYIEITAEDGATMRCDIAQCGTDTGGTPIVFGDTYPLESDFAMAATLPAAAGSDTISVNITPLTDIASKLTLQKVISGANASDAALASNAQVANRLGISGGLIDQPIVDITNADAVNGATKAALEYNLKAAAAIAAALSGDNSLSLEDAVASLSDQFVNGGIADKETTASASITIEEMLEEAIALLDNIKDVDGVNDDDEELNAASTDIAAAEADAEQNGDTTASQGDIPDDVGSEGLLATKAFVKQVRDLANAGVITDNQAAFADQIELTAEVLAGDGDIVAEAMGLALNAIANAVAEYEDAEGTKPSSSSTDGITVDISVSGDTETYEVDQTLSVSETSVTLALNAVNATTFTENSTETVNNDGSTTYDDSGNANIDLTLSGSVASSAAKLSIDDGSSLSAEFSYSEEITENETLTSESEAWDSTTTVENASAELSVTLEQLDGDNPVTFSGAMSIEFDSFNFTDNGTYENSYSEQIYSDSENYTESTSLDGLDLTLSGNFSDTDGNTINATLAASLTNATESCDYDDSYSTTNGFTYSYDCETGETASNYAMASLSIIFDINLSGVADDVNINFSASRTGLETGEGSLDLSYGGNQLNLVYEGGNSVSLSNHNDVVLVLTETDVDDETSVSGTISIDDEQFADVSDDSGTPIVRYSDGSFETLM
ncbi:Uncharacterised protein [Zhongshania aliphaticivorans]|uniref:Uncharacterized protein n=1 Tax=Zhongshania aliphaticivorans TaxID=1470434 RepID=A0A5S9PFH9_9GAMM|nr:hypothetical protein [Zhongshania aliphaticivorans]CAA0102553.1 Uncharacterised protein [Zhongshania aliphaticivorans]CAA0114128.1 Uncharacterised protein [Zhongshania aliphaticivorans]